MQLKMHVFVPVFNTFWDTFVPFRGSIFALLSSYPFYPTCSRIIKRTISQINVCIAISKLQFMYTLSCYCELTPFCRLLKYSLTPLCHGAHPTYNPSPADLFSHDVVGFCTALQSSSHSMSTSANEPRVIWFYRNRDTKPITACVSLSLLLLFVHTSFIYSFAFDRHIFWKSVLLWKSCGLNPNKRQKNLSLQLYIEMVKMEIINLHIKCKKLVIQKCGKITQIFIAMRCAHFSIPTLNIWNAVVFIGKICFGFSFSRLRLWRMIMDVLNSISISIGIYLKASTSCTYS